MDELTRHIQDVVPWSMLFVDNIVLVDETARGVNAKSKILREAQESKGFKLSRNKTEYMECKFSVSSSHSEQVNIQNQEIPKSEKFRYLRSIFGKNCEIIDDIIHMIQVGWLKWRVISLSIMSTSQVG